MSKILSTAFASLFVLSLSVNAYAASPADLLIIQQKQQQILQQRENELRQLERERLQRQPGGLEITPLPETPPSSDEQTCTEIKQITVTGGDVLASAVQRITRDYEQRCLTITDINNLLKGLTNLFIEAGYVTTRAYIPAQDTSDSILDIEIIDGKINRLEKDGDWTPRYEFITAFPGLKGELLNIRDLEQGLDQINRLPSNNAKLKLVPGEKAGETIVLIDNRPAKRIRFSPGISNSGSKRTGELQSKFNGQADNLLGINDYWTVDFSKAFNSEKGADSRSFSGFVSLPYGYWTLSLSGDYFEYESEIKGDIETFNTRGNSRGYKAELDRVIHRDADSKTSLTLALEDKETRNFTKGSLLGTNSRELAIFGSRLNHSRKFQNGILSGSLEYQRGLKLFGALKDEPTAEDSPRAQFDKFDLSLNYYRPFSVAEQSLSWSSSAVAQWSPDNLYSTERISIGGQSTVRGFKEGSASGDVGGYLRNELSWSLPRTGLEVPDHIIGNASLFAAYDIGKIRSDNSDAFEHGTLQGAALGLRLNGGFASGSLVWARPLAAPDFVEQRNNEVYLDLKINF
ncbi:ShlB/FhaC/HecB family hemolysin secretion/activation protein [Kiloniella laminariae]|uniref:ShlB/FhaC/HecB family hemolysin secretion/activation protein n=1 Tax=Kiloniella laminariae TaxID=454162 RepID=A0ABT4LPL1_9PROT|nr:ShlB/FhaC/HecB family hemolysin secretion/activation protein [Kiloniella laminariae]MCZ4283069.1 ShlB/FhaC/HecB family hemolysin secretion/activation protein [Kiloniella laminariae]